MKKYRGYYIDHVVFDSEADIDDFIRYQAVKAYTIAVEAMIKRLSMESVAYAHEKAEILVNEHGFTWEKVEQIESKVYENIGR